MDNISVVTIAKNEGKYIEEFLKSVAWADEIIVVDNASSDETVEIAQKYTSHVYKSRERNLGKLKQFALEKASGDWVLLLDVDELVSPQLKVEIKQLMGNETKFDAFALPYQNYFLGHALKTIGQNYSKVRLFRKGRGSVTSDPVHEEIVTNGRLGNLQGKIYHYSYRSIPQIMTKFTRYAIVESPQLSSKGEKASLKKLTLYPMHMFWAIFVGDKGYRDGFWGFGLAVCFAYYEFAKYFFLLKENLKNILR